MILIVGEGADNLVASLVAAGFAPAAERFAEGVHYDTNRTLEPGPAGPYVFPDDVRGHVVAARAEGLVRTDPAYLERAILVFDDWRRSVDLRAWLAELAATLEDASLRRYPLWLLDRADPDPSAFSRWLGVDVPCAWSRAPATDATLPGEAERVLDEFLATLRARAPLEPDQMAALDKVFAMLP